MGGVRTGNEGMVIWCVWHKVCDRFIPRGVRWDSRAVGAEVGVVGMSNGCRVDIWRNPHVDKSWMRIGMWGHISPRNVRRGVGRKESRTGLGLVVRLVLRKMEGVGGVIRDLRLRRGPIRRAVIYGRGLWIVRRPTDSWWRFGHCSWEKLASHGLASSLEVVRRHGAGFGGNKSGWLHFFGFLTVMRKMEKPFGVGVDGLERYFQKNNKQRRGIFINVYQEQRTQTGTVHDVA